MVSNSQLNFVVYSPFDRAPEQVLGFEVHYLNSSRFDRWDAFNRFPNRWLCFLDADCELTENLVSTVFEELQMQPSKITVVCGRYSSPSRLAVLPKAYNFLCNTWLEAGLQVSEARLIGGFFAIYSSELIRNIPFEKTPKWGAEDYRMALQLSKYGFDFSLNEKLFTSHSSRNDLSWFLKRAWIHGQHRPENPQKNLRYWSKVLLRQSPMTCFYVLLHFTSMTCGSASHWLRASLFSAKDFLRTLAGKSSIT